MHILSLFLALATSLLEAQMYPEIRLPHGVVRGIRQRTESGKDFVAFLGIPYALAPIGNRRFKEPVEHPGWTGSLDATQYRSACAQFDSSGELLGSEDCLHLNVFTRSLAPLSSTFSARSHISDPPRSLDTFSISGSRAKPQRTLLPVLVFFHAESFESGDSSLYGAEKLIERELLLVTLNYRLGALGFLSTQDSYAPGNFALLDQRLALRWVQKNIAAFGGDPHRVTIGGQGAGAASVMYHLVSSGSAGLFHAAIMQSGSALCDWAMERKPKQFAQNLANNVGCVNRERRSSMPESIQDKLLEIKQNLLKSDRITPVNFLSSKHIVSCLRKVPAAALLRAQANTKIFGEFPQRAAPVVESDKGGFINEDPLSLISRGIVHRVPVMIGLNTDEGAYFYPLINSLSPNPDLSYYQRVLVPRFVESTTAFQGENVGKAVEKITEEYFPNGLDFNSSELASRFVQMSTDAMYASCIDVSARLLSQIGLPVHVYQFDYRGSNSMLELLTRLQNENGAGIQNNMVPKIDKHTLLSSKHRLFEPEPVLPIVSSSFTLNELTKKWVCHGDELFSLFHLKIAGLNPSSRMDRAVSAQITSLWGEFVSLKNTSFLFRHGGLWPTFSISQQYLLLQHTPRLMVLPKQTRLMFWHQIRTQYLPREDTLSQPQKQSSEQNDHIIKANVGTRYAVLALVMAGICIALLCLLFILLGILWYTKRSQSFNASSGTNSPSLY